MSIVFHEKLDQVLDDLAGVCGLVETAVEGATEALLSGRSDLAERVISGDAAIDAEHERIEENIIELLSLQSPVAGDLRVLVAALRIISDLERMGDLSVHVAKIARLRTPNLAVPEVVRPAITRMAEASGRMTAQTAEIIRTRDVRAAQALPLEDEEVDQLRRETFVELLGREWTAGVEAAVDVALLGRYYERIADHAVSVAGRIVFVVTGEVTHG